MRLCDVAVVSSGHGCSWAAARRQLKNVWRLIERARDSDSIWDLEGGTGVGTGPVQTTTASRLLRSHPAATHLLERDQLPEFALARDTHA